MEKISDKLARIFGTAWGALVLMSLGFLGALVVFDRPGSDGMVSLGSAAVAGSPAGSVAATGGDGQKLVEGLMPYRSFVDYVLEPYPYQWVEAIKKDAEFQKECAQEYGMLLDRARLGGVQTYADARAYVDDKLPSYRQSFQWMLAHRFELKAIGESKAAAAGEDAGVVLPVEQ